VITTYREALNRVLATEMKRDQRVLLLGETVATASGATRVTAGLAAEFGPRVIETPVSENMLVGAALGGALGGMTMVVEVYSADFLLAAASELLNDIAKWRYQHRWAAPLRLVLRMCSGNGGISAGPEHSQCIEGYLHHAPGLTILAPSSVRDAAGGLRAALRSPNPVVFLEHRRLYDMRAEVTDEELDSLEVGIGRSAIVREGRDVTVVAWSWMRSLVERAAEALASEGVDVEIVDPVTIKPMDYDTIRASVEKTGHLLVVEESPRAGSVAATIVAEVVTAGVSARVSMLTMPDVPHPYAPGLEALPIPNVDAVVREVSRFVETPRGEALASAVD